MMIRDSETSPKTMTTSFMNRRNPLRLTSFLWDVYVLWPKSYMDWHQGRVVADASWFCNEVAKF